MTGNDPRRGMVLLIVLWTIALCSALAMATSVSFRSFAGIGAITGGLDFSNYFIGLSSKVTATALADAKKQGAVLAWGSFLTIIINFLIIAFVLFLAIRGLAKLQKTEAAKPAEPPKPSREVELLTEIRDLLKT